MLCHVSRSVMLLIFDIPMREFLLTLGAVFVSHKVVVFFFGVRVRSIAIAIIIPI